MRFDVTEEQFQKFMEMQFAQLCLIQGIYNCLQAANINTAKQAINPGTFNMKDAKKILDGAAATLKQA